MRRQSERSKHVLMSSTNGTRKGKRQYVSTGYWIGTYADGPLQQLDIDIARRVRVLDATLGGIVTFELELGHEYSNSGGTVLDFDPGPVGKHSLEL